MEACEIARLLEELLSAALSRTSPRDACRAAAVSAAFGTAADSDAVWACFLPSGRDLPLLADGEQLPCRKKDLFLRLSGSPVLLPGGLLSMWLDRETGAGCYMVPARELSIGWGALADSRSSESAELILVCWLYIRGKIDSKMLSQGSIYSVYMVYKFANYLYGLSDGYYGLELPVQKASVSVGDNHQIRKVCIHPNQQRSMRRNCHATLPHKRADGWMELELGEFVCEGHEDGDVSFGLSEMKDLSRKNGLIVQGIEIRHKI
nr:F-box protein At2g02240 [Aegilops tauschii subsp. strangulata]